MAGDLTGLGVGGFYGPYLAAEDAYADIEHKRLMNEAQIARGNAMPDILSALGPIGGLPALGQQQPFQVQPGMQPGAPGGPLPMPASAVGGGPQQPPMPGDPTTFQPTPPPGPQPGQLASNGPMPQLGGAGPPMFGNTNFPPVPGGGPPGSMPGAGSPPPNPVALQRFILPPQQQPPPPMAGGAGAGPSGAGPAGPPQPGAQGGPQPVPTQRVQQPVQPPQMQPQGGPGLDWRTIMQKTLQANPGIKPAVLAYAVDAWLPLMNQQSQEQWKEQSNYIKGLQTENQLQRTENQLLIAQANLGGRAEDRASRERIAAGHDETRIKVADMSITAKNEWNRVNNAVKVELQDLKDENRLTALNMSIEARRALAQMSDATKRELFGDKIAADLTRTKIMDATRRFGIAATGERQDKALAAADDRLKEQIADRQLRADKAQQIKQDIAHLSAETRIEISRAAQAGANWRANLSDRARREIEQQREDAKQRLEEYLEGGRMERTAMQITSREKIAGTNFQLNLQKANATRAQAGLPELTTDENGNVIQSATQGLNRVDKMADDVYSGMRPPIVGGFGGIGIPQKDAQAFNAAMTRRHPDFNWSTAIQQWQQQQRLALQMVGPQQLRFRQLEYSISPFLAELDSLSRERGMGGLLALNQLDLAKERQKGNPLVARYDTAFGGIMGELAQVENGGYAPTDSSWKAAYEQINSARGMQAQLAALQEIRKIIGFRVAGMNAVAPGLVPGAGNPYSPNVVPPMGRSAAPPSGAAEPIDTSGWRIGH